MKAEVGCPVSVPRFYALLVGGSVPAGRLMGSLTLEDLLVNLNSESHETVAQGLFHNLNIV